MKFFISGQINDIDNVRRAMSAVAKSGHTITHDWTTSDAFLGSSQDKLNNAEEAGIRAKNDVDGVIRADIYVLMSDNAVAGKGMYVELLRCPWLVYALWCT